MTYLITFLEGLITFISPCLLPMLPVYVAYFAGGRSGQEKRSPFWKALAFVLGFTVTFGVLGAFAGTIGGLLRRYQTEVNLVCGLMVIIFGLNFLGALKLNLFKGTGGMGQNTEMGIVSTVLFGIVFGLGWTPCIGPIFGSILFMATSDPSRGIIYTISYIIGFAVPFILLTFFIGSTKWIVKRSNLIMKFGGAIMIIMGIILFTGQMPRITQFILELVQGTWLEKLG